MLTAISERRSEILDRQIRLFRAGLQIQTEAVEIIADCLECDIHTAVDICNAHEAASTVLDALHLEVYPNSPEEEQRKAEIEAKEDWVTLEVAGLVSLGLIFGAACLIGFGYWLAG